MVTSDRKVRKLMEEYQKTGKKGKAALRADLDPKTARKYLKMGKLPSQMKKKRRWRTRKDPFAEHWEEIQGMLQQTPELTGKTLFDWLCERYPGVYREGQLRTLHRRVRKWRALEGPDQEVFFPQEHKPGVRMETDFTWVDLGITICGEPFPHLLCHSVLAYSNWEWATPCRSESMLALKAGFQAAVTRLGRIPWQHWTDHSTAATHAIPGEKKGHRGRGFNRQYLEMMEHFKVEPRTIQREAPHENGDVESGHGVLKRRLDQQLLLRGHRDFGSIEDYVRFLEEVLDKANDRRREKVSEELTVMRLLDVRLLPEYYEQESRVTAWSTIQVARNTYSVPSRLKGHKVKARVYEDHVEVYAHGVRQLSVPRLLGASNYSINYRHVIGSLVRKPGAFRHYKYHTDMFPTDTFRWAYDTLCESCSEKLADREYLRILNHAALTMETVVETALLDLKRDGFVPRWEKVLERVPAPKLQMPAMAPLKVNLAEYDRLIDRKVVNA
jgi:hypothetical protein